MLIDMNAGAVKRFLDESEDAEALENGEYTVDLYDTEPPVSMDIMIDDNGVDVLAALELLYDEKEEGWYLGEKIKDASLLCRLLEEAMNAR